MNANSPTANLGKVLVIDDEASILMTLERILRATGYDVQTAQSGREGLEYFGRAAWDLVVLDRSMPDMSGEDVAAEIKRHQPSLPLILITGFPAAVVHRELFHVILGKPFRPSTL